MAHVKIDKFGGQLPMWDDSLLPVGQASIARNTYLYSGALTGWRKPKLLHTLSSSAVKMAYRIPTLVSGTAHGYFAFLDNPEAGDTVKVGEDTYTFRTVLADQFDVLIGVNSTISASNLYKALVLEDAPTNENVIYGLGTCKNPAIVDITGLNTVSTHDFGVGEIPVIYLQAPDLGAAFNLTVFTEGTAGQRLLALYDLESDTHTTTFYQGGINQTADLSITGDSHWLEFADPDTDVIKSPVFDDEFERYYWASTSEPPQYNTRDRIINSQAAWRLGVPQPGCAPIVTITGGTQDEVVGFNTHTGNTNAPGTANTVFLVPVVRAVDAGTISLTTINLMPGVTNADVNFVGVLYSDLAGVPDKILAIGETVTGVTAGQETGSPLASPAGLLPGQSYWMGFVSDNPITVYKADATTKGVWADIGLVFFPPTTVPTVTANQPTWQIWGDAKTEDILETRAYTYTWVSAYGEEGPAAPPTTAIGYTNAVWTIQPFQPPPDDLGVVRNLVAVRIYRTITAVTNPNTGEVAQTGSTTYFQVANPDVESTIPITTMKAALPGDFPIAVVDFIDDVTDDIVADNDQLESITWFPPPENLQGFVEMPNGIVAGFKSNEIWFCEPYRPHAWPADFVLTTQFPIVGLGVVGQALVVCTAGTPYVVLGIHPESMTMNQSKLPVPCISRGSIVNCETGVYYASLHGLVHVDQGSNASIVTEQWISRDRWRELTPSKNIRAIRLASSYFAFGTVNGTDTSVAQDGYTIEIASDVNSFTILPQVGGHRLGFQTLTAPDDVDVDKITLDPWTGTGLMIQAGAVYYYDFEDRAPEITPYLWRSKEYHQQSLRNYEVMKVYFQVPSGVTQATHRNTRATQATLGANQYGILRVYADHELVATREIRTSGELLRIGSGFKAEFWQWEIEGRVRISSLQAATSVKELGAM